MLVEKLGTRQSIGLVECVSLDIVDSTEDGDLLGVLVGTHDEVLVENCLVPH